jgi:hypothetical protein
VVTNSGLKLNKGLNAINVAGVTRKVMQRNQLRRLLMRKKEQAFSGIQGQSDESVI